MAREAPTDQSLSKLLKKVAERKVALRAAEEARQRVASVGRLARERRTPLAPAATAAVVLVTGFVVLWLVRRD